MVYQLFIRLAVDPEMSIPKYRLQNHGHFTETYFKEKQFRKTNPSKWTDICVYTNIKFSPPKVLE